VKKNYVHSISPKAAFLKGKDSNIQQSDRSEKVCCLILVC